jgi:Cu-Zn family superoxide dismutase
MSTDNRKDCYWQSFFCTRITSRQSSNYFFSFKGLLPDTTHGIHIHGAPIKNQNCSNAGGHFNPLNTTHGDRLSSRENRYVGDLGNSVANAKGEIEITFSDDLVTLFGPLNVTSFGFVIHEKVDDLGMGNTPASKTVGNLGSRLACGNIQLVSELISPLITC